jgi:hypothetical protein
MMPATNNGYAISVNAIDQTVLERNSSRPNLLDKSPKWLGFTQSRARISKGI